MILKNNKQKGNYGEMKMDIFFERMGCKRISYDRVESLDDKIKQGIDGVYECKNPPPKYIIREAKYDTSQLRTLPNGTKQMSDEWIFNQGRLEKAVGRKMADEIYTEWLKNSNNISKQVVHVYPGGKVFPRVLK